MDLGWGELKGSAETVGKSPLLDRELLRIPVKTTIAVFTCFWGVFPPPLTKMLASTPCFECGFKCLKKGCALLLCW